MLVFFSLSQEPEEPPKIVDSNFTLQEWQMLGEIYDKEIREMGGITFQNVNFQDVEKELDAIILERVQDKDDEYKELVEGLIEKKNATAREN